jgi:hypothetical protein
MQFENNIFHEFEQDSKKLYYESHTHFSRKNQFKCYYYKIKNFKDGAKLSENAMNDNEKIGINVVKSNSTAALNSDLLSEEDLGKTLIE